MFAFTPAASRCARRSVPLVSRRAVSVSVPRHHVIGIDLGTTNSCVVAMGLDDKPVVVENDGNRTTPSIFAIDKEGGRLVGLPAQRQMVINPHNTFFGVKRLIGRRYDEREVKDYQAQVPYAIKAGPNGDAWVGDSNGKLYSPSEIGSFILVKLKEAAEKHLNDTVTRAVITVPAYFDNHQRQATQDAGVIAGLKVDRIINEPTAAALAYGINQDEDKTIVVYDLGGGTFDVSILQMGGGVFEVKSTAGDTFLGGEDFNNLIANYVTQEFLKTHKVDLSKDKVALQRVREASEQAKHDLDSRKSVTISLPYICMGPGGTHLTLDVTITKQTFEELAAPLVKKTMGPCKKALADASMSIDEISEVLMVGGMTRMPLVRQAVMEFFKKEPTLSVNPDEAVAIGAALQGSIIANQGLMLGSDPRELILVDVTPLNLGIKLHGGEMSVIVPSQTSIPCRLSHTFTTVHDFQTSIFTEVYQGNRPIAKDNRLIGSYTMMGIPPAPAGVPQIEVTFDISANGTIHVTSMDTASKATQDIVINMSGGLSPADIERMRKEAEQHHATDQARQEVLKLKDSFQRDIDHIKKALTGNKSLSAEQLEAINQQIRQAESKLPNLNDKEGLEKLQADFKGVTGPILSAAYQSSGSNAPPSK